VAFPTHDRPPGLRVSRIENRGGAGRLLVQNDAAWYKNDPAHVALFSGEQQAMAKGEQKGNREAKKPKAVKPKVIAAAPSQKAPPPTKGK